MLPDPAAIEDNVVEDVLGNEDDGNGDAGNIPVDMNLGITATDLKGNTALNRRFAMLVLR